MLTPAQKEAAASVASEAITRLINAAPDYGEVGITLTLHAGEVRRVSEQCARTVQGGAK
ncbi:hypothetical protein [Treponema endosymbiont of Eucomonympha sp.]|uniref:hypothetical protein n=1 Tax=Treponema endosymbiont of Eucomonympha sp. TaxID=1580831 RepID=UPI000B215908|nr:hypothetical protein [Treponema endosymbiont of Eucomonympha sp.]